MLRLPYTGYSISPPPLRWFSKLDCSTAKRAPIPNDTCSESSRRDVFQCQPFWHKHYPNCGDIERGKSTQGWVISTVVYGSSSTRCMLRRRCRPIPHRYRQGRRTCKPRYYCLLLRSLVTYRFHHTQGTEGRVLHRLHTAGSTV